MSPVLSDNFDFMQKEVAQLFSVELVGEVARSEQLNL